MRCILAVASVLGVLAPGPMATARQERPSAPATEKVDVHARLAAARAMIDQSRHEEATVEYAWLWEHMLEHAPATYGIRLAFVVADMERLAAAHAPARERFRAMRDRLTARLDEEKVEIDVLVDWVALNRVLNERRKTLEWYDRVKGRPESRSLIRRIALDLEGLFVAERRWADLGNLYPDPLVKLDRAHAILRAGGPPVPEGADEAARERIKDIPARQFRTAIGNLYAGLLAAGREDDAAVLAQEARGMMSDPRLLRAMIETALEAGQARRVHMAWIEQSGGNQELTALTARVQQALEAKDAPRTAPGGDRPDPGRK